ncbi:MAG: DUF4032 domain-containing protein [Actinobacteria bacterium]|nr:DUF4032 domain-containing protein [Actinomycetota bacterium]
MQFVPGRQPLALLDLPWSLPLAEWIDERLVRGVSRHVVRFVLSNLLFRRDAGSFMAYLVDAETAEHHQPLPDGMRLADVETAKENLAGGLLDLQAANRLSEDLNVVAFAETFEHRYHLLWDELTGTQDMDFEDRHLIECRLRRLNGLGFDVGELVVEHEVGGQRLRVTPALVEEGHHSRELNRRTGLQVQENQARRLLNDIAAYGAHLSAASGSALPPAVVAARWIADVYEPIVAAVPPELRGSREAPELFHELLEHRHFLSEAAARPVDNEVALGSYIDTVLRARPQERILLEGE